jgi:protein-L-isoaspartate(D-aspartate) O-methyltransferase
MDPLLRAVDSVPVQRYTTPSDEPAARAGVTFSAIYRDLRRLNVRPGMRILEIGTGTGTTGALLAELVGAGGHVTSVGSDPHMAARAACIHADRGVTTVECLVDEGAHIGSLPASQSADAYHRIIAWAPVSHLPRAWMERAAPGAVIVAPVKIAPLALADVVVRAVVGDKGERPVRGQLWEGGHVDLGPQADAAVEVPRQHCDAWSRPVGESDAAWVSAMWLRDRSAGGGRALLDRLLFAPHFEPLLFGGEDPLVERLAWTALRYFLLAQCPPGLTTACLGRFGNAIGCTGPQHFALVTGTGHLVADSVDSPALSTVLEWQAGWERAGRPGMECLRPRFERATTGWEVRAVAVPPPRLPECA